MGRGEDGFDPRRSRFVDLAPLRTDMTTSSALIMSDSEKSGRYRVPRFISQSMTARGSGSSVPWPGAVSEDRIGS